MANNFHFEASDKKYNESFFNKDHVFEIPRYQRPYSWGDDQTNELWDDLNSERPSFFGAFMLNKCRMTENTIEVIDGQQRLRTIWGFFDGVLPDGSPFYLRGVDPQWNGKKYENLNETDKIRFRDSILRVVIVEQLDPEDMTSIYHIFERLNTGGTSLTPQEVRNSSYHGPFNDMLFDLNEYINFKSLTNFSHLLTLFIYYDTHSYFYIFRLLCKLIYGLGLNNLTI